MPLLCVNIVTYIAHFLKYGNKYRNSHDKNTAILIKMKSFYYAAINWSIHAWVNTLKYLYSYIVIVLFHLLSCCNLIEKAPEEGTRGVWCRKETHIRRWCMSSPPVVSLLNIYIMCNYDMNNNSSVDVLTIFKRK